MFAHWSNVMNEEIYYTPVTELATQIRRKALSPVEVVQAHLDRIDQLNSSLNAIVFFTEDPLHTARESEAAVMRGDELGPLHGIPYTLKDCIETAGIRMSLGSKIYDGFVSQQDSEVYTRLRAAGGILLGKTNMPEFALWWETDNEVFGTTRNPWNLDRTAGGSSGGEVAAIAAGLSPFGLGTDLGGSIRAPASFCGVVGLKPTLGRVPYTGIQPQTLLRAIHVGPIARTVGDVALIMSVIAGADDVDLYCPPVPVPDYGALEADLSGLKVGWSPTTGVPVDSEVQRSVAEAAAALGEAGLNVEPVEIPALAENSASAISTVMYTMEARRYSAPAVAGRESELTPLFRARFVEGNTFTMDEYLNAADEWEKLSKAVKEYFANFDIFLCPTVPIPAFPHGQNQFHIDGRELAGRHTLRITLPWDLTGSPAISVPYGLSSDGLPIGVQVVGRHFDELKVLQVARLMEIGRPQGARPPVG